MVVLLYSEMKKMKILFSKIVKLSFTSSLFQTISTGLEIISRWMDVITTGEKSRRVTGKSASIITLICSTTYTLKFEWWGGSLQARDSRKVILKAVWVSFVTYAAGRFFFLQIRLLSVHISCVYWYITEPCRMLYKSGVINVDPLLTYSTLNFRGCELVYQRAKIATLYSFVRFILHSDFLPKQSEPSLYYSPFPFNTRQCPIQVILST